MSNTTLKVIASVLMTVTIGTASGCHSGKVARPPTDPARLLQATTQPSSFVGTVPVARVDEGPITPMETVAAAPD